jgi:hypothetical protein
MTTEKTPTKSRKKSIKNTNPIDFRIINLHGYDVRDIKKVVFTTKGGETIITDFIGEPTEEKKMIPDTAVYIQFVEQKPYYAKYKIIYHNSSLTTQDLALASFVQVIGQDNPNYFYEF